MLFADFLKSLARSKIIRVQGLIGKSVGYSKSPSGSMIKKVWWGWRLGGVLLFVSNIKTYYNMVGVAVALLIPTMHEKACMNLHNAR